MMLETSEQENYSKTVVFPCSVTENYILERLIFCIVNASAIFRSKQNQSKCSKEGDFCIPVAEGGGNVCDISSTIAQNKTVSWEFCQSDFWNFLSPTFNRGGVHVYVHSYEIFFFI